jgi:aminodeoxyfutalosine deaminase
LNDTAELLKRVPKAELHLHLGGMMTLEALLSLIGKYHSRGLRPFKDSLRYSRLGQHPALQRLFEDGVEPESFEDLLEFDDFDGFIDVYGPMDCYVREPEDYGLLADSAIHRLVEQSVTYAEIEVPFLETMDCEPRDVAPVLDRVAADAPLHVSWIAGIPRHLGAEASHGIVRDVLDAGAESVTGITMGGLEQAHPHREHAAAYRLAREAGLGLTVHAGEAAGPQSVWSAINDLGVDRIGHGVRAIEDELLVAHLVESRIPLEVCPTSNVFTGIYPDLTHHPIRRLYEAGVVVTLNSDDPSFFGANLLDEYMSLHALGWGEADLLQLVENGFNAAFIEERESEKHLERVKAVVTECSAG